MNRDTLAALLDAVARGELAADDALGRLDGWPSEELGFATLDTHRPLRRGMIEAVYAESKTNEQVVALLECSLARHGAALATRVRPETGEAACAALPALRHCPVGRVLWKVADGQPPRGLVAVVAAGTSDLPVVEEAARTLEVSGSGVARVTDVGVAGLHRLLPHLDTIRQANAIVVVAGMEGALPSVVAGMTDRPIIAVPTSIGYGAHFGGLAPLLAMLNSCAPGVSVVNIDNGYGAACSAHLVNALVTRAEDA